MSNRRKFIKQLGAGILSTFPITNVIANSKSLTSKINSISEVENILKIGIIGAENSHSYNFGKKFNIEKNFPGVEVSYIWGETDEFAKISAEKGRIPNIVKNQSDMSGKINALIVDHRHGKYHLDSAQPFVEAGIPTFVDKPFCYRAKQGKDFLIMARKKCTAVTSLSSMAYTPLVDDIIKKIKDVEKIGHAVIYGPSHVHSKYGGVFYYVVHSLQIITRIFGESITRVRVTGSKDNVMATMEYESGFLATMIFVNHYYGFNLNIETSEGLLTYTPTWETIAQPQLHLAMIKMFRTGIEPRSHQSILNEVCVLEALEKSLASQKWENIKYVSV